MNFRIWGVKFWKIWGLWPPWLLVLARSLIKVTWKHFEDLLVCATLLISASIFYNFELFQKYTYYLYFPHYFRLCFSGFSRQSCIGRIGSSDWKFQRSYLMNRRTAFLWILFAITESRWWTLSPLLALLSQLFHYEGSCCRNRAQNTNEWLRPYFILLSNRDW